MKKNTTNSKLAEPPKPNVVSGVYTVNENNESVIVPQKEKPRNRWIPPNVQKKAFILQPHRFKLVFLV